MEWDRHKKEAPDLGTRLCLSSWAPDIGGSGRGQARPTSAAARMGLSTAQTGLWLAKAGRVVGSHTERPRQPSEPLHGTTGVLPAGGWWGGRGRARSGTGVGEGRGEEAGINPWIARGWRSGQKGRCAHGGLTLDSPQALWSCCCSRAVSNPLPKMWGGRRAVWGFPVSSVIQVTQKY